MIESSSRFLQLYYIIDLYNIGHGFSLRVESKLDGINAWNISVTSISGKIAFLNKKKLQLHSVIGCYASQIENYFFKIYSTVLPITPFGCYN